MSKVKDKKRMSKQFVTYKGTLIRDYEQALAAVAQWIECWPVNQRVTGSVPRQGTCLDCRPGPPVGDAQRATMC